MNDIVAQIFGYGVLIISASLFGWEIYVYRRNDEDAPWLKSPARLKRRMFMAFLLLCVGLLILAESTGILELDTVRHLVIYVCLLIASAMLLFILSVRDLGDMARSAERHALDDLKLAMEEQRRRSDSSSGSPSD